MIEFSTRPSSEGANIRAWIGFKHFEYAVADAVSSLLSDAGFGQRDLARSGVRAQVCGSRAVLTHVIECGDELTVTVSDCRRIDDDRLALDVQIMNVTAGQQSLKGTYLVRVKDFEEEGLEGGVSTEEVLGGFPRGELRRSATPRRGTFVSEEGVGLLAAAFSTDWTVPYYYCESSRYLSYRGHVRALESIVDDYLAAVGLFIPTVLSSRAWIPVVSRYSIDVCSDVDMGSTVRTHFTVDDVLADVAFDASWATTTLGSDGTRRVVASGVIQHGYAYSRGERAGSVVRMDPETMAHLKREVVDAVAH